jgi:hypothetical protein
VLGIITVVEGYVTMNSTHFTPSAVDKFITYISTQPVALTQQVVAASSRYSPRYGIGGYWAKAEPEIIRSATLSSTILFIIYSPVVKANNLAI